MHPIRSYLICATPRSGSTLLCEALMTTGIAGYPREYFEDLKATRLPRRPKEYFTELEFANPEIMALLGDYSRLDHHPGNVALQSAPTYAGYLAHVFQEGTTANGVFGAKLMWGYFDDFISNLRDIPAYSALSLPALLATVFPHLQYIWVSRCDKVQQAISLWKAIQTETWREDEALSAANHYRPQKEELHFHFAAIDYLVERIKEHEQAWQQYFQAAAIQPYHVVYEELSLHYETTARQLLTYLHVPLPEQMVFAGRQMKRQADALSDQWVERYYALKQQPEGVCISNYSYFSEDTVR